MSVAGLRALPSLAPAAYPALALLLAAIGVYLRLAHPDLAYPWYDEFRTLLYASGHSYEDLAQLLQTQHPVAAGEVQNRFLMPDSGRGLFEALTVPLRDDPHHSMLYYGLVHLLLEHGTSPLLAARMLSATFSVLLLPASFWLAWEFWGMERSTWISVALVAVAPIDLYWAFEARTYALWAVSVACACAALLRALKTNRWSWWLGYAAMSVIAVHAHLLTVLVLSGHVVYVLLRERAIGRRFTAALACVVILIAPWLLHLASVWEHAVAPQMAWTGGPRHASYWHHFSYALGHGVWGSFQGMRAESAALALIGLGIAGATLVWFARNHWRQRDLLLLLLFAAIPVPMAAMDLLFGGIRLAVVRYFVPSSFALTLMLARVLTTHPPKFAQHAALLALIGTATVCSWSMSHHPLPEGKWRSEPSTIAGIKQAIEAADKPLVVSLGQVALPATLSLAIDPAVPFLFLSSAHDTHRLESFTDHDVFILDSRNLLWYYEPYAVGERQLLARLGADVSLLPVARGLLRIRAPRGIEKHAFRAH